MFSGALDGDDPEWPEGFRGAQALPPRAGPAPGILCDGRVIGLSVVKRLVDRHGSRVRVESRPGEGSTFALTLPAA